MNCPNCGAKHSLTYAPPEDKWYCDFCETYVDDDQADDYNTQPYKPPSDVEIYRRKFAEWNQKVERFNHEKGGRGDGR